MNVTLCKTDAVTGEERKITFITKGHAVAVEVRYYDTEGRLDSLPDKTTVSEEMATKYLDDLKMRGYSEESPRKTFSYGYGL